MDIWASVPDALASAANQLKEKGWRSGIRWGHEVRAPRGLDCTIADPDFKLPVREWLARGFVPSKNSIASSDIAEEASLILPAGNDGPAFLLTRNYTNGPHSRPTCAQLRCPIELMVVGSARRLRQALQAASMMAS